MASKTPSDRLVLITRQLTPEGEQREGSLPPSLFDLEEEALIRPDSEVGYELNCSTVSEGILVRGTAHAKIIGTCDRCLGDVPLTVQADVSHFYEAVGDSVDATDDLREDLLMAFPSKFLCQEDCRGLCPVCGIDWNEGTCSCEPADEGPSVWSQLDGLKL